MSTYRGWKRTRNRRVERVRQRTATTSNARPVCDCRSGAPRSSIVWPKLRPQGPFRPPSTTMSLCDIGVGSTKQFLRPPAGSADPSAVKNQTTGPATGGRLKAPRPIRGLRARPTPLRSADRLATSWFRARHRRPVPSIRHDSAAARKKNGVLGRSCLPLPTARGSSCEALRSQRLVAANCALYVSKWAQSWPRLDPIDTASRGPLGNRCRHRQGGCTLTATRLGDGIHRHEIGIKNPRFMAP